MPWNAEQNATQLVSITTEQFFDKKPILNPGETCQVEIDCDFPGSPTDNLVVSVYATLDGSNFDIVPLFSQEIDNGDDPSRITLTLSGIYGFRIGVSRSGTTDTITSADMSYKTDGINVA